MRTRTRHHPPLYLHHQVYLDRSGSHDRRLCPCWLAAQQRTEDESRCLPSCRRSPASEREHTRTAMWEAGHGAERGIQKDSVMREAEHGVERGIQMNSAVVMTPCPASERWFSDGMSMVPAAGCPATVLGRSAWAEMRAEKYPRLLEL